MTPEKWQLLGIAPSTDPQFIKKNYLGKLEIAKLNQEPKAVIRQLNEAYQDALAYAKAHDNATKIPNYHPDLPLDEQKDARVKMVATPRNKDFNEAVDEQKKPDNPFRADKAEQEFSAPYLADETDSDETLQTRSQKKRRHPVLSAVSFVIFLVAVFLLPALGKKGSLALFNTHQAETTTTYSKETDPKVINATYKKNTGISEQFLYYFYLNPDDPDKADFIEKTLTIKAKNTVKGIQPAQMTVSSEYYYQMFTDRVKGYGLCETLAPIDNPTELPPFILGYDAGKIVAVYSPDFNSISSDDYQKLWEQVYVTASESVYKFIDYLTAPDRLQALADDAHFYTPEITTLLEKYEYDPIEENYESGSYTLATYQDKQFCVIQGKNDQQASIILGFNEDGAVDTLYSTDNRFQPFEKTTWTAIIKAADEKMVFTF